jgi:5-(carboxyamino)imidazole ribonucleotide mutase
VCAEESRKSEAIYQGKIMERKLVSIVMGSDSDLPVMKQAAEILDKFGIGYEIDIVSAHRTPEKLYEFASNAHSRGIVVIIAGAGGAAHLPGMVAAISPLPVIGVPIKSSNSIDGWDSVLSILQMPGGVPVATVALNGAKNAGILAAQIVSAMDNSIQTKIIRYKQELKEQVITKSNNLNT